MKSLANEFFGTMADGAKRHAAAHTADFDQRCSFAVALENCSS
jgi:ABC-type sugar transport system substrate-binding protein